MILELLLIADIMSAGTTVEHFVVPDISFCAQQTVQGTCTSLEYNINYSVDACVFPYSARVVYHGREIPFTIEENGERGRAGYTWTMRTTEIFAGDVDLEITMQAISACEPST